MIIAKGATLGPYEILGRIGEGGMGEVWRARDERIGRDVAIKVLPDRFDEHAVLRFEQEARAAGSLNHPGLVTIFDVGTVDSAPYLVMELLEGETLRDAIGRTTPAPLPLRKALDYAVQIASALAVAHERGIVHRDLKPENVFITSDRRVKILDFGLAKLVANENGNDAASREHSPANLTGEGTIVGTPAYMSPEQVRAGVVDHRSDIFSFGAVLYELISGKPAFRASSAFGSMHAILSQEPEPIEAAVPGISSALAAIVHHCIEKDPNERFQSARDLAFDLRMLPDMQRHSTTVGTPQSARRRLAYRAAIIGVPLLIAAIAAGFAWRNFSTPAAEGPRPYKQLTFAEGVEMFPTLSADGKVFAYVSSQAGNRDIYVQRVDGRGAINVTSDSLVDDSEPAISPDGSRIAFRSERDGGGIFVMGVTGESVIRLSEFGHNPSWSPSGERIVFSTVATTLYPQHHQSNGDLWVVSVRTSGKRLLFQARSGAPDIAGASDALQPSWSPHGHRIAFWGVRASGQRELFTIRPDAAEPRRTIVAAVSDGSMNWNPAWSPSGRHLYFGSSRNGTLNLWRIRIDEQTGKTSGKPELMSLPAAISGHYAFSQQGDLAFTALLREHRLLAFPFDAETAKTGAPQALFGFSQDILSFEPSPDRRMIAFGVGGPSEDLFVADADGSRLRQLTNDDAKDRRGSWSPDGKRIFFYSNRSGDYHVWSIAADGSGLRRETAESKYFNPNVSPDGRTLAVHPAALVHLDAPLEKRLEVIAQTIHSPQWSPDGTQLVGGAFTDAGPRSGLALYSLRTRQVEKILDRGFAPHWFPDGRRVAFFENDSIGILDLATREVISSPFTGPPGVRLTDPVTPRMSKDGSTVYLHQTVEHGDVWMVRLDDR